MELLLYMAGVALLAHIALCFALQRGPGENRAVLREIFATPNERLLGSSSFRLLRARYYLPWRPVPGDLRSMTSGQRLMLTLAQISGLLMPICFLFFIAASVIQAIA